MDKYGLGPGIIGRLNLLPYSSLFYIASKVHDVGYERGGDYLDKLRVDNIFLKLMLSVSKNKIQIFFANFYYKMVRSFGDKYFNYK